MLLYIDPGTGSMLFSVLIGIVGALVYFLRSLFIKIKFKVMGGKAEKLSSSCLPFVIFTDSKRYWNIFKPICDEFEKRGQKLVYITASEDDPAFNEKYEHIVCEFAGKGNKAFSRMNFINADIVLSTTPSLDVFQWKRSRDVKYYVHIPHQFDDLTLYRMFGIDHYDGILCNGQFQIDRVRALEKLRKLPRKDMYITGVPFLDTMAKKPKNPAYRAEGHKRTVLLAPSWGDNSILARYGERALEVLKATGYNIIVRPHPQSFTAEKEMIDRLMAKFPNEEGFEWNRDNDNFDVLDRSDILISDFSAVMFEYVLIFDKPILYAEFEFDRSVYDAWWLEEAPWTFRILPEIGDCFNEEQIPELGKKIDECIENEKYKLARDKMRNETWQYQGHGAEMITDYLLKKREELLSEKKAEGKK